MKMRNTAFALLALVAGVASAQVPTGEKEATLVERVTRIENKSDRFNLYFNMHYAFDADFTAGDFEQGAFNMHQFRIEAKGKVNNWLSYRWRQRLNRTQLHHQFLLYQLQFYL